MQLKVLRLVVKGYSNPAIAEELYISVNDVKWHLRERSIKKQATLTE